MFYLTLAELACENLVNSKIYISRQCFTKNSTTFAKSLDRYSQRWLTGNCRAAEGRSTLYSTWIQVVSVKFKPSHFFWKALWLYKFEYSIVSCDFCLTQQVDTLARQNQFLSPPEAGFGQYLVSAPKQDEIFWLLGVKYRPHKSDGDQTRVVKRETSFHVLRGLSWICTFRS